MESLKLQLWAYLSDKIEMVVWILKWVSILIFTKFEDLKKNLPILQFQSTFFMQIKFHSLNFTMQLEFHNNSTPANAKSRGPF